MNRGASPIEIAADDARDAMSHGQRTPMSVGGVFCTIFRPYLPVAYYYGGATQDPEPEQR
eukprot:scaffold12806_cov55-Attheya_sp.AAC.5